MAPLFLKKQRLRSQSRDSPDMDQEPGESEYVTLVSCDGFEFVVRRSAAMISGTIKSMLNPRSMYLLS